MKLVFFGTSNVALPILEALSRKHVIAAVVTMPDAKAGRLQTLTESPVSVLADEMKLDILKPEKVKGNAEFHQTLQNIGADLFVVVSYGQILPSEIINMPKYKTINVHFSLLPKYRGPSPIQTALLNGETQTGMTIFILDERVDHWPILTQRSIPIDTDDNSISLSRKLAFASAELVVPTIDGYASGSLVAKPQDDAQATHTQRIDRAHGKIDWNNTARQIYNQFRAFYPWPGIWTKWDGKVLKVIDCVPCDYSALSSQPGQVLEGGAVACAPVRRSFGEGGANTFLQIKTLQLEGKKETSIIDFLNGYGEFVGSVLK